MQLQHQVHEAARRRQRVEEFPGARVERLHVAVLRRRYQARRADHQAQRVVLFEYQEAHHFARPGGQGAGDHVVVVDARRLGGERLELRMRLEVVLDLLVEDQRQPGEAKHQQEDRGDQAGPFVHQVPGAQGFRGHWLVIGGFWLWWGGLRSPP
ncbi:Uncharacterised protein [Acinetobacter baumannii]|nr:Uncharacterised protein [Acinetobacter baumannii]